MKKGILKLLALLIISISVIYGCSPKSRYERRLKQELAKGVRYDSLFLGLYLGMPEKDFYIHCWELNKKGLIKQGSNNTTVEYRMQDELKHPGIMNFYPSFVDGKIAEMPVKLTYAGWAPWNQKLSSDSLQLDVMQWIEKMYGNRFIKVDHPKRGSAYIKMDGNRRITIFRENDLNVWAVFSDMSVVKELFNQSRIDDIQEDSTRIIK
jgi:hypothetical protein